MEGLNTTESTSCSGCLNNIGDEEYVTALGQEWHRDCFRCSVCDATLSSWYLERGGLLFCRDDYWLRYGHACHHCQQMITGPVMSAGEHRFHPECFACSECGCHIEDAHTYALVDRTRLYCGGCYKCMNEWSHAIRVVEVPAHALTLVPTDSGALRLANRCAHKLVSALRSLLRAAIAACLRVACSRIDAAYAKLCGDRVLEVNGAPLSNLADVLQLNADVVQLTVEHNPNANQYIPNSTDLQIGQTDNKPQDNRLTNKEHWLTDNEIQDNRFTHMKNQDKQVSKENKAQGSLDTGVSPSVNQENMDLNRKQDQTEDKDQEWTEKFERPKLDTKSPIERKILKEDKKNIPNKHSSDDHEPMDQDKPSEEVVKRERLFKRKGEDAKGRVLKRRQTPASPLLGDKERSSSMSKLLDAVDGNVGESPPEGVLCDLSRARSFRAPPPDAPSQTVFRAADLIQGELLGAGFFGQVYKVTHRATNEVMVLKQLYRVDDDAQRNFLKEVAVLRSLSHPNVLRFIGVLYKEKRLHLVTEYVAGGTLHELLQACDTPLGWVCRARLARDVARGVGYLHRMNVIHRDLNSHNCLVREDQTVIVADFGLARIVQRTASSTLERPHARSRKRYTVVGNPYWMAPEMMNGNVYDEKVDVFSFGIILCEIIGRVSADPDYLPRRADFGLNEAAFVETFCRSSQCPEPFYRIAFLACDLDPDRRPPFEVLEIWLESLAMQLNTPGSLLPNLLADIAQYAHKQLAYGTPECCHHPHGTPRCCQHNGTWPECCGHQDSSIFCGDTLARSRANLHVDQGTEGVVKSKSNAAILNSRPPVCPPVLGKCVSASHIVSPPRPVVTVTSVSSLSRSQHALGAYILRATPRAITITQVEDISLWVEGPPLKRSSADAQLNAHTTEHAKARTVDAHSTGPLPNFLRNQSVEGLESTSKKETDTPVLCRHTSVPDHKVSDDSSSEDDDDMCDWYNNVSAFRKLDKIDVDTKNVLAKVKDNFLAKKCSYDVNKDKFMAKKSSYDVNVDKDKVREEKKTHDVKNDKVTNKTPKVLEQTKAVEKTNFFTKKLMSPKLSRLFKPNTTEVVRNTTNKTEDPEEKSRSKFFIQRPASPGNIRSYKIRPTDDKVHDKKHENVIKSDLKLASMGKPMTPIFRRHIVTEKPEFAQGRFSYRDRRPKYDVKNSEPKFVDVGRNRIKTPITSVDKTKLTPLLRSSPTNNIPALATVLEQKVHLEKTAAKLDKDKVLEQKVQIEKAGHKCDKGRKESGISRSNYVSLANLRINSKKDLEQVERPDALPAERVI